MITCPNCNGNVKFDIASQKLHCSFCDASYDPYAFDDKSTDVEENKYETTIYTCPQCAGELESTDTDVTGFCPFCGASDIFYSRLSNELKPDYIIPFKKTKEDCKKLYMERAKKAMFLPKEYKDAQYIDGFRGIYVPYWSYNITQKGPVMLRGEKSHREGDYIIHKHYQLSGNIDSFYNGMSHDASSSFSDDISERIAPFDIKAKEEFTAGYLSGFYADTADVTSETYEGYAKNFAMEESRKQIDQLPEFARINIENLKQNGLHTEVDSVQRTMFPVWFMSYRNNDRVAYATVNGQTGKVTADFPIDIKKFLGFAAVVAIIIFAILNLMFTFKPSTVTTITAILSIITFITYLTESNAIAAWETNINDKGMSAGIDAATKKKLKAKVKKGNPLAYITSIVAFVIALLCRLSNSIHDYVHYGTVCVCALCIGITLTFIIKDYNKLATRPLPQFAKKGGDDDAN